MGRVLQYFQYLRHRLRKVHVIFFSGILGGLTLVGCSVKPPKAPSLQTTDPYCQGIKITGAMTTSEFKNLFHCLNKTGALNPLKPLVVENEKNTLLLVEIYNNVFGLNPDLRHKTLSLLRDLHDQEGLDDFLTFTSELISEFVDSEDFDTHLKGLLETILQDDLDLLTVLKAVVLHTEAPLLFDVLKESYNTRMLEHAWSSFGLFLKTKNHMNISGAQHVTNTLKTIFTLPSNETPSFTMDDVDQLNVRHVTRNILEELFKLKRDGKLSILTRLLSDLAQRQTVTLLTEQRRQLLEEDPENLLSPSQRIASEEMIRKHPLNDLVALIKLASSLHRGFLEDENHERNQNLLASIDIFQQGVKSAFDVNHSLGPDAKATRVMTTYTIYANIAYQEIMFSNFHKKSLEEKITVYKTPGNPYSDLYARYQSDYKDQKTREERARLSRMKQRLEEERDPDHPDQPRWSRREIVKKLSEREIEFRTQELPPLMDAYVAFLDPLIEQAFTVINTKKIFMESTIYDLLIELKEVKSIALFFEKLLLNLDNEGLDRFITKVIQGCVKDFFEFHRPVDQFMRSLDKEHSGATWLSHTIDPLIYGFSRGMPMKDQITLIALVESYQILERLLLTENHIQDLRDVILPFIKAINKEKEDERVLKLFQFLHSGEFTLEHSEERQLLNQMSPLLVQMIESGFLNDVLDFLSALGKRSDTTESLLSFLTLSQTKRSFLEQIRTYINPTIDQEDLWNDIEYLTLRITKPDHTFDLLIEKIGTLQSEYRHELIHTAQHKLLLENPPRLITPVLSTLKNLSINHQSQLTRFFEHLGIFLTPQTVSQLTRFLEKYDQSLLEQVGTNGAESFLTQLIKRDEMGKFLEIVQTMLEENIFKSSHLFIKELIDTGELKKAIHLLTLILLSQGG